METKSNLPVWEDEALQSVVFHQALSYVPSLRSAGIELADLVQEAALVFMRCLERFDGRKGREGFLQFFKSCWARRLIDLHRRSRLRGSWELMEYHQLPDRHASESRADLDFALEEAPEEVRAFVTEFEAQGLKSRDDDGTVLRIADFCQRATGQSWRVVRRELVKWAELSLCPA